MQGNAGPAKTQWFFPDAFLPDTAGHISHEAVCVLNLGERDARVEITLFFEDRAPLGGFADSCPAGRTRHIRTDKMKNAQGAGVPPCTPYAIQLVSDVPVLCQYTRVDASRPGYALMTSMGL